MIKLDDGSYQFTWDNDRNGRIVVEQFINRYRKYIDIAPGSWNKDFDLEIWDYIFEEEYEKLRC